MATFGQNAVLFDRPFGSDTMALQQRNSPAATTGEATVIVAAEPRLIYYAKRFN